MRKSRFTEAQIIGIRWERADDANRTAGCSAEGDAGS